MPFSYLFPETKFIYNIVYYTGNYSLDLLLWHFYYPQIHKKY